MRELEHFLLKGDIRKYAKDTNLQKTLLKACHDRLLFIQSLAVTEQNARFILEEVFNCIIDGINANIVAEGFLSESDEASLAFLQKYSQKVAKTDMDFLERLLKTRDSVRKYGNPVNIIDAKQTVVFARRLVPQLKGLSQSQQFYRLE
jgi:hypothetical protein